MRPDGCVVYDLQAKAQLQRAKKRKRTKTSFEFCIRLKQEVGGASGSSGMPAACNRQRFTGEVGPLGTNLVLPALGRLQALHRRSSPWSNRLKANFRAWCKSCKQSVRPSVGPSESERLDVLRQRLAAKTAVSSI